MAYWISRRLDTKHGHPLDSDISHKGDCITDEPTRQTSQLMHKQARPVSQRNPKCWLAMEMNCLCFVFDVVFRDDRKYITACLNDIV